MRDQHTFSSSSSLRSNGVPIAILGLLALSLLLLQSFLHGHITAIDEYDDGVYFGASLNLAHGIVPYRSFAFIQPPMISVLLLPFAALGSWTTTSSGLEWARALVDLIALANVLMVGVLVRRRPMIQLVLAMGIMAFFQGTYRSSQTVLLEPFLVLFCLLATHFLIEQEAVTRLPRKLWLSGMFFGIAGATKLWAVFPLLVALGVAWSAGSSARRRLAGGVILGFAVCSVPFFAAAPGTFIHEVFIVQFVRNGGGYSLVQRLGNMTGIAAVSSLIFHHRSAGLLLLGSVLLIVTGVVILGFLDARRAPWSDLERLALWSTAVIGLSLFISPTYYYHYAAFLAPYAAIAIGSIAPRAGRFLLGTRAAEWRTPVSWGAVLLLLAVMAGTDVSAVLNAHRGTPSRFVSGISSPGRGCVLDANPTAVILANRFTADQEGCPTVVDWFGQERDLDDGRSQTASDRADPALQRTYMGWLKASQVVLLGPAHLEFGPRTMAYLTSHFRFVTRGPIGTQVYVRRATEPLPPSPLRGRADGRSPESSGSAHRLRGVGAMD
jgi:hypothetical protein